MNETEVLPHLSWAGPQPHNKVHAYCLALLVRLIGCGLKHRSKRTPDMPPSSLTTGNLKPVAMMYAYCTDKMHTDHIITNEGMLEMIRDSENVDLWDWCQEHKDKVNAVEAELLEFVSTKQNSGFMVYG